LGKDFSHGDGRRGGGGGGWVGYFLKMGKNGNLGKDFSHGPAMAEFPSNKPWDRDSDSWLSALSGMEPKGVLLWGEIRERGRYHV
jgi:hypothetical protein